MQNTQNIKNSSIYLDANFLLAFLVDQHSDQQKAVQLFTDLMINSNKFFISALVIDETLMSIKRYLDNNGSFTEGKVEYPVINKVLKKFKMRMIKVNNIRGKSFAEYAKTLELAVNKIILDSSISVIQFSKSIHDGITSALVAIKDHNLKPRDSFHYAYIKDQEIEYLLTNDDDFKNVIDVKIIKF